MGGKTNKQTTLNRVNKELRVNKLANELGERESKDT